MNDLPQNDYLSLAEATLAAVEAAADAADLDTRRDGAVLTLEVERSGQIIINLQPAIQELWLASRAGAYHFKHRDAGWIDTREGRTFEALLAEALTALGGPGLQLNL